MTSKPGYADLNLVAAKLGYIVTERGWKLGDFGVAGGTYFIRWDRNGQGLPEHVTFSTHQALYLYINRKMKGYR
jgi:hypothetical protein